MRYAVVIEKAGNNFSAYVPDLPGCIATGATVPEVEPKFAMPYAFISKACVLIGWMCPKGSAWQNM
jgi:hypothetical protein